MDLSPVAADTLAEPFGPADVSEMSQRVDETMKQPVPLHQVPRLDHPWKKEEQKAQKQGPLSSERQKAVLIPFVLYEMGVGLDDHQSLQSQ
jgi:hypothetical protein